MQEEWSKLVYPKIPDELNRFEVSTYGRLRNSISQHIYKQTILNSGYCSVRTTLGSRNKKIHILIHKAVAYTFLSNPDNLPEVNHKDGVRHNNKVTNLEWCTSHENQQHKYDTGLFDKSKISGENNNGAKLSWKDVEYIRANYIPGSRQYGSRALARKFGITFPTLLAVVNNKTWICGHSSNG